MLWIKILAFSTFALGQAPVNGSVSDYNGIALRPDDGDIRWTMTAQGITDMANELLKEENAFHEKLMAIEVPTVENVLIPTYLRDNHVACKINELDFYQYVSEDSSIREASANFKSILKKDGAGFQKSEEMLDPYKKVMERVKNGDEPGLDPEILKYLEDLLVSPNRTEISEKDIDTLYKIKEEISDLESEFLQNVANTHNSIELTTEELTGVPLTDLKNFENLGNDRYKILLEPSHMYQIFKYATSHTVRKNAFHSFYNQYPENEAVLDKLVKKRYAAAKILGYNTHADYILRDHMAKDQKTVTDFIYDLEDRLKPIAEKELARLLAMKNKDLREANLPEQTEFFSWDFDHYHTAMLQKDFSVNQTAMSEYYPTIPTVPKLLGFFEKLYDVRIVKVSNPSSDELWSANVLKYAVYQNERPGDIKLDANSDAEGEAAVKRDDQTTYEILYSPEGDVSVITQGHEELVNEKEDNGDENDQNDDISNDVDDDDGQNTDRSSQFMGWLVLDIFAREGKYPNAATFEVGGAFQKQNGKRIPAYAAVVCSVPPELPSNPSLLTPLSMSMIFHEMGHGFHILLSKTKTVKFSGSHVPMDFIECPSQVLESFMTMPTVLKAISQHYKTGEQIHDESIEQFTGSMGVNAALNALKQLYAANFDMEIHILENQKEVDEIDVKSAWNSLEKDVSLVSNDDIWNNGFAQFTHVVQGYDASYYSYAWSLIYAADIFETLFAGKDDITTPGIRLREVVLRNGGLKNPMEYLTTILGRAPSSEAFMRRILKNQPK